AKHVPHRPRLAPTHGLRAGNGGVFILPQTTTPGRRWIMRAFSWLRERISGQRSVEQRKAKPAPRWRPRIEALEDRTVPSTLFVTNGGVDDVTQQGSLRWAVAKAQDGDTIVVKGSAVGSGITLESQLVLTQRCLTIEPQGNAEVTITEAGADRIFSVS